MATESESQRKVADAEVRLRQHRDRTIALLAEKDKELEILRDRLKLSDVSAAGYTGADDQVSFYYYTIHGITDYYSDKAPK